MRKKIKEDAAAMLTAQFGKKMSWLRKKQLEREIGKKQE